MQKHSHSKFPFTVSSSMLNICKPLEGIFDANLFIYQRSVVNEGTRHVKSNAYLCSNEEVLNFVVSLPQKTREPAKYDYGKDRKYILMGATQPVFTSFLQEKFGVHNLLSRDERISHNEWEHFIIGTTSNSASVVNSYFNNMGALDKFVTYFRSRAKNLIDKTRKNSFISGRPMERCNFNNFASNSSKLDLSAIPDPKHYYLSGEKGEEFAVPKSCMHCLILTSQGKSMKEAAKILGISPRTVESHIASVKARLRCNTKGDLLRIMETWKRSNIWAI